MEQQQLSDILSVIEKNKANPKKVSIVKSALKKLDNSPPSNHSSPDINDTLPSAPVKARVKAPENDTGAVLESGVVSAAVSEIVAESGWFSGYFTIFGFQLSKSTVYIAVAFVLVLAAYYLYKYLYSSKTAIKKKKQAVSYSAQRKLNSNAISAAEPVNDAPADEPEKEPEDNPNENVEDNAGDADNDEADEADNEDNEEDDDE